MNWFGAPSARTDGNSRTFKTCGVGQTFAYGASTLVRASERSTAWPWASRTPARIPGKTSMHKLLGGLAAFALLCAAPQAHAAMITRTYEFAVTNILTNGPSTPAPVDEITGSFTLTFDPTVAIYNSTAGLVVNNLSYAQSVPMGFSFTPFGMLGFGGLPSGVAGASAGTDDFYIGMFQPLSSTPIYGGSFFSSSGSNVTWSAVTGSITAYDGPARAPAIPEPGTWALLILGFGLAGAALRDRRTLVA